MEKTENSIPSDVSVLALHGFTGSGSDFDFPKSYFPENYRWDTPDLPPLGLDELCAFLRSRWEKLPATRPRILLGYSMGGRIALHLAYRLNWRPEDKLVLVSASPGIDDAREREARRLADEALAERIETTASAEKFYAEWLKTPIIATQQRLPEPWKARVLAQRAGADRRIWAEHLRILGTGTLPSLWPKLSAIPAPETRLVVGAEDLKFLRIAEAMQKIMPCCSCAVIPDSGHAPHWENAQAFRGTALRFPGKSV